MTPDTYPNPLHGWRQIRTRHGERDVYRPELRVVDCTIRDGGLCNDSWFTLEAVRSVFKAVCASGVDVCELGYRNSKKHFSTEKYGPWRFCDEEDLLRATDGIDKRKTQIAIMQDAHKADPDDIPPKEKSIVDMIRIATYVKDLDKAVLMANNATDKGYISSINIMAISHEGGPVLDEALQRIEEETKVQSVYIVDSFGALYSEEIFFLVEKYQQFIKTKEIGIHAHNNQQLAFANTMQAMLKGVNYLDATLFGLGRGAGNCPLELLLGFLKNPKFDILPILECVGTTIVPLQKEIAWGYHMPYMLTGMLDQHPESSMDWLKHGNGDRYDYVKFYRKITQ